MKTPFSAVICTRNSYLLFCLALVLGCSQQVDKTSALPTNIKGYVHYPSDSTVLLQLGKKILQTPVQNKAFTFESPIFDPTYALLHVDNRRVPLYLLPGFGLQINLAKDEITFEGKAAESNRYLQAHQAFTSINQPNLDTIEILDEMLLKQELRRFRSKEFAFHKKYLRQNINLDPKFMTKERGRILYRWGSRLHRYFSTHPEQNKRPPQISIDQSFDYKQELSLEEGQLIGIPEYESYVRSVVVNEAVNVTLTRDMHFSRAASDIVDQIDDQAVKDFALEIVMEEIILRGRSVHQSLSQMMDWFLAGCQNGDRIVYIQDLEQRWQSLRSDKHAPAFTFVDIAGRSTSSRDLKDRFTYLLFWSTVQDPAQLEQLITLDDLDAELPEVDCRNIFAGSVPDWLECYEKHPELLDYRLDEAISTFQDTYLMPSFPAALLFDPQGKLIALDAALPGESLKYQLKNLLSTS